MKTPKRQAKTPKRTTKTLNPPANPPKYAVRTLKRPGPKVGVANATPKSEHVTFCVRPEEKERIEALAASSGIAASPLIHRYLFTKSGDLRPIPVK